MDNPLAFMLFAFFLYWLCEGLGLLFQKAFVEIENKILFNKILRKIERSVGNASGSN